jgi:putative transcriptional regulator
MSDGPYFEGDLLVAMPGIGDPRFDRTVIYLCSHSPKGAMGLVINKRLKELTFKGLLDQLELDPGGDDGTGEDTDLPLYAGGPVEPGRGFVLHSPDYVLDESTLKVSGDIALTATIDILKAMAAGTGPDKSLVALGYAGWQPGQLDRELTQNGWLTTTATREILFDTPDDRKWPRALASLGIDVSALSSDAGHA